MKLSETAINAMDSESSYVPQSLRCGLVNYIEKGRPVGSFVYAVLCNDLRAAVFRADPDNRLHLSSIVRWIWNYAPLRAWGSEMDVLTWMEIKRMDTMEKAG